MAKTSASFAPAARPKARRSGPPPPAGAARAATEPPPLRFNAMPTFKLDVLGSLTAKHGELLYQRLMGLRTVECRVLGVVAQRGPVTLRQTCLDVGIDKGQGSRLVAQLLQAGWLDRQEDPADQRSFYLLLTAAGRQMHHRIATAAAARNELWMQGLAADQRAMFVACIDVLTRHTQQMLAEESARSGAPRLNVPAHEQAEPAPDADRPLVVAPALLRDLQRRLAELLGDV